MKKFDKLPEYMRTEAVYPYYEILQKKRGSLLFKRIFDVVIALVLFIILLPVNVVLALLVGLTSKGGVFFCQKRVTTYGREFKIIKFRTMVADAPKLGTQVTTNNDMRVTKVGRFLRKVRLDELPQLINIIKGDMSIVGTRPEVPYYVGQYTEEMYATLLMPAGVTSKASIEYKDEEKILTSAPDNEVDRTYVEVVLPEKMKYNLAYIKEYSFMTDIRLMFETVFAVLR